MDTGRRGFLKYIGAGLTGVGLGRYQNRGFRPRELGHDLLSYDGVPDLYLEHGLLEDELKPQYTDVLENFTPSEENVLVDFLVVEGAGFDTDIVESLAQEFEEEGINFGFFERPDIIDRNEYEQISRPEELIGDPRSPVELLGADNDLMDEKISDIMLESAIQVAVTPEVELTSPTGDDADGYAYRTKAVVTSLDQSQDYWLLKHEIGHTLGLLHSEDTVMSINGPHEIYSQEEWNEIHSNLS